MVDPIDPDKRETENRKLADAVDRLAKAAEDLGSLNDAVARLATAAVNPATTQAERKPKKKRSKLAKVFAAAGKTSVGRAIAGSAVGRATSRVKDAWKEGQRFAKSVGLTPRTRPTPPPPAPSAPVGPPTRPTAPPAAGPTAPPAQPTAPPATGSATGPTVPTRPQAPPTAATAGPAQPAAPPTRPNAPPTAMTAVPTRPATAPASAMNAIPTGVPRPPVATAAAPAAATGAGAGAAGAGLAGIAGKAIPVIGAFVAVAGVLNDFRKYIQEAADAALESKRKFVELSGSQAAIFAEQDMKQMHRDIRRGDNTAESTKGLADAVNERKDQFAPLETAIDNATNRMLATGQDILNSLLATPIEVFTTVVETFDSFVKDFRKTFHLDEKKDEKNEFGTLADLEKKIFADAREASTRARAALEKNRAAVGGVIKPRGS